METDWFLVAVPLEFVVVKKDKDWIVTFVLSGYICFDPLNVFVPWCSNIDLFWGDYDAPRFGAGGRATGRLD